MNIVTYRAMAPSGVRIYIRPHISEHTGIHIYFCGSSSALVNACAWSGVPYEGPACSCLPQFIDLIQKGTTATALCGLALFLVNCG